MKSYTRLFAILMIFFCIVSCKEDNTTEGNKGLPVTIKINLLGAENETITNNVASNNKKSATSESVQRQIIPFDQDRVIVATLTQEAPAQENSTRAATNRKVAAVQQVPLQPGTKYKVVVYNSDGSFNTEKDYIYGQNDSEGFQLNGDSDYTFIAYSLNTGIVPAVVNRATLAGAKLSNISGDLMFFKTVMRVSGNQTNYLNVILKHRFCQVTTKIDATGMGNVTAASNALISPTNSPAEINFASGTISYSPTVSSSTVTFPNLGTPVVTSTPTLLIAPATTAATLKIGNLTIGGISRNNFTVDNLTITPGAKYTLNLKLTAQPLRTIRILSFIPDEQNRDLTTGSAATVAKSKLTNPANFGVNGTVKITGFTFNTLNVSVSTPAQIATAIDNADIIWIGAVAEGYWSGLPDVKAMILQKVEEKKKFFFLANDYLPIGVQFTGGYAFKYWPNATVGDAYNISLISGAGPNSGVFGNATGSITQVGRIGYVTQIPANATIFMRNTDGTANAIAIDNFISVGDADWYSNSFDSRSGFYNGTNSATENNNSIIFCNIFEKAINYIMSQPATP